MNPVCLSLWPEGCVYICGWSNGEGGRSGGGGGGGGGTSSLVFSSTLMSLHDNRASSL